MNAWRRLIAVLFVVFLLLLLTTTTSSGAVKQPTKVYVTSVARRILRQGYDTATTEKMFCARTRFTGIGSPYVDTAFVLPAKHATATGVQLEDGATCPPLWGTAHWHLGTVENSYPWSPSYTDIAFAACNRAPFHLIVAPDGEYLAYGFGADFPEDACIPQP